jgi:hypothetical protein
VFSAKNVEGVFWHEHLDSEHETMMIVDLSQSTYSAQRLTAFDITSLLKKRFALSSGEQYRWRLTPQVYVRDLAKGLAIASNSAVVSLMRL